MIYCDKTKCRFNKTDVNYFNCGKISHYCIKAPSLDKNGNCKKFQHREYSFDEIVRFLREFIKGYEPWDERYPWRYRVLVELKMKLKQEYGIEI